MSAENNTAPATTPATGPGKTAADKTARASAAVGDSHTGVTRTHSPRSFVATTASAQANREWFVIDATDKPLGRLASTIATVLRGKHKPTFTPHEDAGDFVIVVNADKVRLTGNKLDKKFYYSHSGIPGGFAAESYRHLLARKPTFPVEKAVKGMLPKNVLGRQMLTKLKLYASADHPHVAQKPQPLTVKL